MSNSESSPDALLGQLVDQLIDLQTQVTFQDDTIQTLNDQVAKQQQDIMDMRKKMDNLVDELKLAMGDFQGSDISNEIEKPPHY